MVLMLDWNKYINIWVQNTYKNNYRNYLGWVIHNTSRRIMNLRKGSFYEGSFLINNAKTVVSGLYHLA